MLPESFQNVLAAAGACASRLGHTEVTVTHVTYVLSTTGALNAAFRKLGKDARTFEDAVLEGLATSEHFKGTDSAGLKVSQALARCIAKAEEAARGFGRPELSVDDFLVEALQNEHGNEADGLARRIFLQVSGRPEGSATPEAQQMADAKTPEAAAPAATEGAREALETWASDLVAAAARSELDEVFGRDEQIGRLCKILSRRKKSNPILVGEPGVGKTAVVEGLAVMIAGGEAPAQLRDKRIYALDTKGIVSGTRNRGDLEERFKLVLDAVAADQRVILFIDEIHSVMTSGGAMAGIADLLKPALASSRLRCIGATTSDEFARYFGADPAMVRRFQEVQVNEPGRDAAVTIVGKAAASYASHHGVSYSDKAIAAAVDLSIRHLTARQLPDKALDILDEAGAAAKARGGCPEVVEEDIIRVVRDMSGDKMVGMTDPEAWRLVADDFMGRVNGQRASAESIIGFVRSVASHPAPRSGARASFLLSGPSGSGKRHVAESLAASLELPLLSLDMGAYGERSAVSALVGAPPGYIGYEDGGKLTEFVRRHPVCILFMDKIDLAHPAVRDIVAAAVGKGQIADARGRIVSFRNVIVVASRECEPENRSFGFHSSATAPAVEGVPGLSFDRMFAMTFPDVSAASDMVAGRIETVAETYRSAGLAFDVGEGVVEAVVSHGSAIGGRWGDHVSAYGELFEAQLFKSMLPRNGSIRIIADGGRLRVEVLDEKMAC